ncbi:DEAD-domain-containing protein [Russula dissimulans]|nr:DEAD-domain-containing protein [Russula dissimulans]
MTDNFVLNVALEEGPSTRREPATKVGRWTDRLKSKRVKKRRTLIRSHSQMNADSADERPPKRPRQDSSTAVAVERTRPKPRQPPQVISSLFSSNPRLEKKATVSTPMSPDNPSNAPLADNSSFTGLGLNPLITTHLITRMNILKPTSIQRASLSTLLSPSDPLSWRDAFIQSQTGSGKTLSYLLPILHDLLPLSTNSYIDRSIGTVAIIISPTRELANQILDVLDVLLKLRLRPHDAAPDDEMSNNTRLTRWLVSGVVTGGATRTHEKARLRRGIPILVATPGRLLDHLQNTSSFDFSKCRWLVLDEADRLMELGFAETIKGILACLDGSRKLALEAVKEGLSMTVRGWNWRARRRTILCSATMRDDVQVLAGTALQNPIIIKTTEVAPPVPDSDVTVGGASTAVDPTFAPPSQLLQKYIVVPLKLRLVTLIALLRFLVSQSGCRGSFKIIVFLSCTDSVDFHWRLLGASTLDDDSDSRHSNDGMATQTAGEDGNVEVRSPLLPGTSIFRLHGSLPPAIRLSSLRAFSSSSKASVLLCTSVAARGLDLPRVRAVVQYDLPTEGGATEYVHRVGRTARVGRGGQAWTIIAPSEEQWVEWVHSRITNGATEGGAGHFEPVTVEDILQAGFGGQGREYEDRATEVQLAFERWCLRGKENAEMARKAFASHLRAYATHPSVEKHIFHIRHLHLGHLAKSFALREAPSTIRDYGKTRSRGAASSRKQIRRPRQRGEASDDGNPDVQRRMQAAVRNQGRLVKKGGVMIMSTSSEFQVASGDALERFVNKKQSL